MLSTLAVMVLFAAITVAFSKEIAATFKKARKTNWVRLFFPLTLVSALVLNYESLTVYYLLAIKAFFTQSILLISQYLPFPEKNVWFVVLLLWLVFTLLPSLILEFWCRLKKQKPYAFLDLLRLITWLFVVLLLST